MVTLPEKGQTMANETRLRRGVGQRVIVTCRESGKRLRLSLASIRPGHFPSGVLAFEDPDGVFDIETAPDSRVASGHRPDPTRRT